MFGMTSESGEMVCVMVPILEDSLVECEEQFTVRLSLVTEADEVSIGQATTEVTIADNDGIVFNCHYKLGN